MSSAHVMLIGQSLSVCATILTKIIMTMVWMAHVPSWIINTTALTRLPWPLAVSPPAAQYGCLWSLVNCRDRQLSQITALNLYIYISHPGCVIQREKWHLHCLKQLEKPSLPCSADRDAFFNQPQSSTVITDMIRPCSSSSSSNRVFALYL